MTSVSIPFTNNTISLSETTTSVTSPFTTTESESPFDSSSSSPTTIQYNNETLTMTLFQNETQSSQQFTESSTPTEQTTFITEILRTSKEPEKQEPACIVSLSNLVIITSSNDEISRFIQDSESQFDNVKKTVSFFMANF